MEASEKEALETMVANGLLERENAEIILRFARSERRSMPSIAEPELQALVLLIDKSESIARELQLFSISGHAVGDAVNELDSKRLPGVLESAFLERRPSFKRTAPISVVTKGQEWHIDQRYEMYVDRYAVRRDADALSVYSRDGCKADVIKGQHHLLRSLLGSSVNTMYLGQMLFNFQVEDFQPISEFRSPDKPKEAHPETKLLTDENYAPEYNTRLYDAIVQAFAMLAPCIHMAKKFGLGAAFVGRIGIITDGHDEGSKTAPEQLRTLIGRLTEIGALASITLVGIGKYDYRAMAASIGITDVIPAETDSQGIRRAFDMLSDRLQGGR